MFTGIVEATGRVEALRAGKRLVVSADLASAGGSQVASSIGKLPIGASIAVNGVCLTLVARRGRQFEADLGPETLAMTTLGELRKGDRVHLERPLRLGDPLGGHLVAGHVDGVGQVVAVRPWNGAQELRITAPSALAPHFMSKGSITVDGVSLTINRVRGREFSVVVIPHTLSATCLGERRPGDRVNIEADLISKHIANLVKSLVKRVRR